MGAIMARSRLVTVLQCLMIACGVGVLSVTAWLSIQCLPTRDADADLTVFAILGGVEIVCLALGSAATWSFARRLGQARLPSAALAGSTTGVGWCLCAAACTGMMPVVYGGDRNTAWLLFAAPVVASAAAAWAMRPIARRWARAGVARPPG